MHKILTHPAYAGAYQAVHKILTHPAYAGAYVYGRTRGEHYIDASGTRPASGRWYAGQKTGRSC